MAPSPKTFRVVARSSMGQGRYESRRTFCKACRMGVAKTSHRSMVSLRQSAWMDCSRLEAKVKLLRRILALFRKRPPKPAQLSEGKKLGLGMQNANEGRKW